MSSYVVAQKDVEKFLNLPSMNDQEGISFAYATDPDALAKLIPAPLKLAMLSTWGGPVLAHRIWSRPYLPLSVIKISWWAHIP